MHNKFEYGTPIEIDEVARDTSPNFRLRVGDYEWSVHRDTMVKESNYLEGVLSSEVSDFAKPYFGDYVANPDGVVKIGGTSVTDAMANGFRPFSTTTENREKATGAACSLRYDAVLHLHMFMVACKLEMGELKKTAAKKLKHSLRFGKDKEEHWACITTLVVIAGEQFLGAWRIEPKEEMEKDRILLEKVEQLLLQMLVRSYVDLSQDPRFTSILQTEGGEIKKILKSVEGLQSTSCLEEVSGCSL